LSLLRRILTSFSSQRNSGFWAVCIFLCHDALLILISVKYKSIDSIPKKKQPGVKSDKSFGKLWILMGNYCCTGKEGQSGLSKNL
jgi:hypothetical protein